MKIKHIFMISFFLLFLLLMLNAGIIYFLIDKMQLDGRVVNFSGIVRDGTQRLVKLEMAGIKSDQLIDRLDKIVDGLINGDDKLNLPKATDINYLKAISLQV